MTHRTLLSLPVVLALGLLCLEQPRVSGQDKPEPPEVEYKAVSFRGEDEKQSTKKLNDLAGEGWEYVGPLGDSLVAFKRTRGTVQRLAAKKAFANWQGAWDGNGGEKMTIKGDRWTMSSPNTPLLSGSIRLIDIRDKMTLADLIVEEGIAQGRTCKAIFRMEGDTLQYCGAYSENRPTEFKPPEADGACISWKRVKP